MMTVAEYSGILEKIESIGRENRLESQALRAELASTRESLKGCQARCWVEAGARKQLSAYLAMFLVSAFGCTLAFVLNTYGCHLGR